MERTAADPEIVANEDLRRPLQETFAWITGRMGELLREAPRAGGLSPALCAEMIAATMLAVRQGGYVLARAANSSLCYEKAVEGLIALIASHAVAS